MSYVSDHRCYRCSNQQHLRVQPPGRGPWSLHQPNGLHLCRVPAGRGGGGTERCPTGLQPYWHEQTLWLAAFWNRAVMWLARGNDESVCWLFRRAPSDWSAGCLSLYSRPECLHGWLCQLCQYFWEETCRDASHSRWDDDVLDDLFQKTFEDETNLVSSIQQKCIFMERQHEKNQGEVYHQSELENMKHCQRR